MEPYLVTPTISSAIKVFNFYNQDVEVAKEYAISLGMSLKCSENVEKHGLSIKFMQFSLSGVVYYYLNGRFYKEGEFHANHLSNLISLSSLAGESLSSIEFASGLYSKSEYIREKFYGFYGSYGDCKKLFQSTNTKIILDEKRSESLIGCCGDFRLAFYCNRLHLLSLAILEKRYFPESILLTT